MKWIGSIMTRPTMTNPIMTRPITTISIIAFLTLIIQPTACLKCVCNTDRGSVPCVNDICVVNMDDYDDHDKDSGFVKEDGLDPVTPACAAIRHPVRGEFFACTFASVQDQSSAKCTVHYDTGNAAVEKCWCKGRDFCNDDLLLEEEDDDEEDGRIVTSTSMSTTTNVENPNPRHFTTHQAHSTESLLLTTISTSATKIRLFDTINTNAGNLSVNAEKDSTRLLPQEGSDEGRRPPPPSTDGRKESIPAPPTDDQKGSIRPPSIYGGKERMPPPSTADEPTSHYNAVDPMPSGTTVGLTDSVKRSEGNFPRPFTRSDDFRAIDTVSEEEDFSPCIDDECPVIAAKSNPGNGVAPEGLTGSFNGILVTALALFSSILL